MTSDVAGPHGHVPVRWYEAAPRAAGPSGPVLVWLHGGGFFRGGVTQPEAHDVAEALASRGVTVVTVAYRLTSLPGVTEVRALLGRPALRYPLPVDDVTAVLGWVKARTGRRIIIGGASAGACIAAGALLRCVEDGAPVSGAVFAYGFFHAIMPARSRQLVKRLRGRRRVTHAPIGLDIQNRNYAGARMSDRYAFPGGHDLAGFPPALFIDADRDIFRASSGQFAVELRSHGAHVERHVLPESQHAFLNRPQSDDFLLAIDQIATWTAARDGD